MRGLRWTGARLLRTLRLGLLCMILAAVLVPSMHAWAGQASSPPLVFAGSGSSLAITRLLIEAFRRTHPAIAIAVPESIGSSGGVRAVAEGAITVGLVSRPVKDQGKGWGLTVLPYARTAVVVGAHPTVADEGITLDDLVRIYRGAKTRWQDGREIIVLTREPGDSSLEALERASSAFKEAYAESSREKRWAVLYTDQEMNRVLTKTPYAIGLSDLGGITAERLPIKVLKVNGVPPTPENVRGGRYPLVKTLAFVFRQDTLPPMAKAVLDFVRSREGAEVLRANGYLPGE